MPYSVHDNYHELGEKLNTSLFFIAFEFFTKLQRCSGLIKHLLSDCVLCCWFCSIWLQPLWPELILSILYREITRGWQDQGEEREQKWATALPAKLTRQKGWKSPSVHLPFCFFSFSRFLHSLHISLNHTFLFSSFPPSVCLFISLFLTNESRWGFSAA